MRSLAALTTTLLTGTLLLAGSLLATPAHAAFAHADSYIELGASLPIARQIVPDSPCRDREQVEFRDHLWNTDWLGFAYDRGCAVALRRDLITNPPLLCTVLAHEFGHLGGLAHDPEPGSLMHPRVPARFEPCRGIR